jgi:hypothetical protein
VVKKGQIVKIKKAFHTVCNDLEVKDLFNCQLKHVRKNLRAEVIEISRQKDGFYDLLVKLYCCGELHTILISPDEIELDTIKTLKSYKNGS